MALGINTNPVGMQTANQLNKNHQALGKSLEKIASGYRLNQAADDASGLAIADALNAQARGLGQAVRNASDAISIVQTADGALEEATRLLTDIQTKAIAAGNPSLSAQNRQALQAEVDKSLASLDSIAQDTSFNGRKLLSGEFSGESFQVGASSGETVVISIDSMESRKLTGEHGTLADIDLTTEQGAQDAITIAGEALDAISRNRSNLGSSQNQLESTINNLYVTQQNITGAESMIRDVDYANELDNFNRLDQLGKAQSFALAQVKHINQNMIKMLV